MARGVGLADRSEVELEADRVAAARRQAGHETTVSLERRAGDAPGGPVPNAILALQRSAGNRAVTSMLVAHRSFKAVAQAVSMPTVQRKGDCGCGCEGAGSCGGGTDKEDDQPARPSVQQLTIQRDCKRDDKRWEFSYDGCSLPAKVGLAAGGGTSIDMGMGGRGAGAALTFAPWAGQNPGTAQNPFFRAVGGVTDRGGATGMLGFGSRLGPGGAAELGGYGGYSQNLGAMGGLGASYQLGNARLSGALEASQREGVGGRGALSFGNDAMRAGIEARASQHGGMSAMAGVSFTFGGFGGGPTRPTHPRAQQLEELRPRGAAADDLDPSIDIPDARAMPGGTSTATHLAGDARNNPAAAANPAGAPDTAFAIGTSSDKPCDRHDECYQTCGSDQAACDAKMHADMLAVCDKTSAGGEVKAACFKYAEIYHQGLKAFGAGAHRERQAQVCGCEGKPKGLAVPAVPGSDPFDFHRNQRR